MVGARQVVSPGEPPAIRPPRALLPLRLGGKLLAVEPGVGSRSEPAHVHDGVALHALLDAEIPINALDDVQEGGPLRIASVMIVGDESLEGLKVIIWHP